jgi:hypothetical protein
VQTQVDTALAAYMKAGGLYHPSGVVVEIVEMERGDQGCSCDKHHINGGEVMVEDFVMHLHKVQIMVKGWEETAITAFWMNNGINHCHIGFLPCHMVKRATQNDGAVAQVTHVFSMDPQKSGTLPHGDHHMDLPSW